MPSRYVYEDALGQRGQGAALRFLQPAHVTVLGGSREETIVVSDTGNHRLQMLGASGQFVRTIGGTELVRADGTGRLARGLRYPMGVVSDENGDSLVVADMLNRRLLRLRSSDGAVLANQSSWQQSFGHAAQSFTRPRGLALHSQRWGSFGKIPVLYVADAGNNHVSTFALAPPSPGTISLPGLVSSASGSRIIPLISFGQPGDGASDMSQPVAVCAAELIDAEFGRSTRVWVADQLHDRVQEWRFHPHLTAYQHVRNLGASGVPAQLVRPSAVSLLPAADRRAETSRLFISEARGGRGRVHVFDANEHALQVIMPPSRSLVGRAASVSRPLGGIAFARRSNTDASADAHRLVVAGGGGHNRLFIFRRERV